MASRSTKISFGVYLLLAFLFGALLTYLILTDKFTVLSADEGPGLHQPDSPCDYKLSRITGYEFVRPLLSAEPYCESAVFAAFKPVLDNLVDSLRGVGALTSASVYLREFDHGQWLSYNEHEQYHPASLMKVPLMLSVLRIAESTPGLLAQKIKAMSPTPGSISPQHYQFPGIESGKDYTLHELLYYTIANSDNHAARILGASLPSNTTEKLFSDLGLDEPENDKERFTMTAEEVSVFFKAIFNSSYLSPEYSDYAARLLNNCAFGMGFKKGFPAGTPMWHKFGERRSEANVHELHESGIVYVRDEPFLITIMTKGHNTDRQAESIAVLCRAIHKMLLEKTGRKQVGALPRNKTKEALNP